tara:strand:+ start:85 stop:192 length:108 start_codon:yes stop_codon:yes gene_type:complete
MVMTRANFAVMTKKAPASKKKYTFKKKKVNKKRKK